MKSNKEKIIKFIPSNAVEGGIFNPPVPASKLIPEWYKNQNKYTNGTKEYNKDNGNINHTIKGCMPVFDMMTAGYIYTLPADVFISRDSDGTINTLWSTNSLKLIESHPRPQYDKYSIPKEYESVGLKFINPWITQTPKGYSCLFIQPSFRDDLPFSVLPAVVDTDEHPISVNFPFFIRKDFEGMIPMGTPIMQIIPFKRDSWSHQVLDEKDEILHNKWKNAEGKMSNRYKTFFRSQKSWK
jgi:hypothetical protein